MSSDDDQPEPPRRIAQDEEELRQVLAGTSLAPVLPYLRLAPYFPRSFERVQSEEHQSRAATLVLEVMAGVLIATAALSLWRLSIFPLVYGIAAAIPVIIGSRQRMRSVYAPTSHAQRFIELMTFDHRAPIVYLRPFKGEDPQLPALRAGSVVARAANPTGTDSLENLAQLLEAAGPVVGLGRPDDQDIAHRIYRLYTPDEHWREVVKHLLGRAKAVLMPYEKGPIIDWELSEAIRAAPKAILVLVRGLKRETVRDERAALAAVPSRIKALGRPTTWHDAVNDRYGANEHGLLIVVMPDAVRVHAVKIHFQQLWDVMLREIVHTVRIAETRGFVEVPGAYMPLVQSVAGASPWWDIGAVLGGAAAVVYAWLVLT